MLARTIGLTLATIATAGLAWVGCSSDDAATPSVSDAGSDAPGPVTPTPEASTSGRTLQPGEVTLSYGSCPALTPCGGDPVGVWTYAESGCVAELTTALCANLKVVDVFVKAKGTVTVTPTSFKREVVALTQGTAEVPKSCAGGLACSFVGLGLQAPPPQGAGFDSATCVDGPSPETCICTIERRVTETTDNNYTLNGNTITTSTGTSYPFCVEGDKMTYRDRFQNLVDGNIVMKKQ